MIAATLAPKRLQALSAKARDRPHALNLASKASVVARLYEPVIHDQVALIAN